MLPIDCHAPRLSPGVEAEGTQPDSTVEWPGNSNSLFLSQVYPQASQLMSKTMSLNHMNYWSRTRTPEPYPAVGASLPKHAAQMNVCTRVAPRAVQSHRLSNSLPGRSSGRTHPAAAARACRWRFGVGTVLGEWRSEGNLQIATNSFYPSVSGAAQHHGKLKQCEAAWFQSSNIAAFCCDGGANDSAAALSG